MSWLFSEARMMLVEEYPGKTSRMANSLRCRVGNHTPQVFLPPDKTTRFWNLFPIWDDVQTFDGTPWRGIVDVVSGGFPCRTSWRSRKRTG